MVVVEVSLTLCTVYCVVLVFSSYTMSGGLMRFRNRGVHGGQQLFATQQELFY